MNLGRTTPDWDRYRRRCPDCGHRWHESEGRTCEVCEERADLERWAESRNANDCNDGDTAHE